MNPCAVCGQDERGAKSGDCLPCSRRRTAEWRAKHIAEDPDFIKKQNEHARQRDAKRAAKDPAWAAAHREKARLRAQKQREKPGCRQRETAQRRVKWYGVSLEDQERMLREQEGKCAACAGFMLKPCLDHDHATGQVRAFLCQPCNNAIGHLKDSPQRVRQLLAYLLAHPPKLRLVAP